MTGTDLLPIASGGRSGRFLLRELAGHRAATLGAVVLGIVAAAATVVPVYVFGVLVDRVTEGAPASTIIGVVAVIVVAAVVGGVFTGLGAYTVALLGERILASLRERVVARALTLPVDRLDRAGRGDLLSRVGDDVAVMAKSLSEVVPQILAAVLLVVVSIAAMLGVDWRLGLAGMVAIPLYVMALRWYLPRSAPLYASERVAMGERAQALVSSMQGARTVRAYGVESEHLSRIDAASAGARDIAVTVFRLFTRFGSRSNRAECVGLSVVLLAGFLLVRDGSVTVGETTAAALLFHRLFNPIGMLMYSFDDVQSAGASLARLVGVLDLPDAPRTVTGREPGSGRVELVGIRHSYDGVHEVIHGLDLTVANGETVALVGSTGAGKSTLAAIVAGSTEPTAGTVRIGGVPLTELAADRVRRHVAVVSQEVHVFAGPLIDDLRLAAPDASEDEVQAALDRVGAGWVADLPDGVHTVVGEGGLALTAARAQHVALARLVLADPAVAVLDEATAEAGSAGARDLEDAARAATRGRTTIVVAHRLTQAAAADRVVVLEHGRIVEQGSHDDLVRAGGRYHDLWSAWSRSLADR
ncbi:ABC transporter ATP-binding protein [Rhodococcoides corynebacterioides]|uniref:ABC transporter ATP-binding protein n=1 Tax=Rhodococcoides corynebacterioides TaxID=53972 RepID=UPI0008347854|nr:ABC transporter ATP-binding protein [Rhodococcus corynebacterioides]